MARSPSLRGASRRLMLGTAALLLLAAIGAPVVWPDGWFFLGREAVCNGQCVTTTRFVGPGWFAAWIGAAVAARRARIARVGPNVSRQFGGSIDQADKRYWMQHQGKAPIQIRIDLPETLVEREIDEADWYSYPDGTGCAQSSCMWLYRTWSSYCDLSSVVGECGTTPVDYGFQNSATFTVYWSIFYIDPAPAGFTIVPDA